MPELNSTGTPTRPWAPGDELFVIAEGGGSPDSIARVNSNVSLSVLANLSASTILGRITSGTGTIEVLNAAQVRTILNVSDGAQVNVPTDLAYAASTRLLASSTGADVTLPLMSSTEAGLVPASGGGTTNFLRADGTFAAPSGGGGVLNNLTATTAPTVSNDSAGGYAVGSRWLWAAQALEWVCVDATVGAAVWARMANRGRQTIFIPAAAMVARITNGPSDGIGETATNRVMRRTLDFDAATAEFAQFAIAMPKGWNEGTIAFQPIWSHAATTTNFGVVWTLAAVAHSDGDAIEAAFGTAVNVTDTGGTTDTLYIGPESSAVTIAGTPAEMDQIVLQIGRLPTDAADTMAIDARLHGVRVYYTTNVATDD